MANARKKNTIYIDSTGTVTVDALKPQLYFLLITPSAADSRVVIKESVSGVVVIDIKVDVVASRLLDVRALGIELTSSFEVSTLTNITTVLLYGSWNQPVGKARDA